MNALRGTNPRLLAYLTYMVERLLPMRGILKPTGSIYLHCDPTASHYIKVMMDAIFDHKNFKNEIIWSYRRWPTKARKYQSMHDVILFYAMSGHNTFNVGYEPPSESTMKRFKGKQHKRDLKAKRNIYLDEAYQGAANARRVGTLPVIAAVAKERMGYATQKPLALLNRIIETSTNEGDVVFDPFCGCATTLEAAHRLGRRWIGIDIAIHAVKRVARVRLQDRLGLVEGTDFEVQGAPRNVEGARDLWTRDKYNSPENWAVEEVDGFVTTKRTADGGVDGRLYFGLPNDRDLSSMVIEVKGGKSVAIESLRALRGVLETGVAEARRAHCPWTRSEMRKCATSGGLWTRLETWT